MKKIIKLAAVAVSAAAIVLSFSGCKHEHKWEWHRTETEHWEECTFKRCKEERNRGTHTDSVCEECAEFRAIGFGFADCIGAQGVDDAHADFAMEANEWFAEKGKELGFIYDAVDTYKSGWDDLTEVKLKNYELVILLNDKPGTETSRTAFKNYVDTGGACMAFHAAGFAMWDNPDTPPTEWDGWFSNEFLRCGVYGNCPRDPSDGNFAQYWNTWNPTSEPMKIETHEHFSTENLDFDEFVSAPCEWYEWYRNLFEDEESTVLISMNPTPENPAGDDTRPGSLHQVWRGGRHAIAWTNSNYNMIYMNWGHNLRPYNIQQGATEGGESSTFSSEKQNRFMLEAMFGLIESSRR